MAGTGRLRDDELIEGLGVGYLKWSGFWQIVNHFRDTGIKNRLYRFWMWSTVIGYTPLFMVSAIGPFYVERNLEGLTLALLNPMSAVQVAVKLYVVWQNFETQARLMDLMKKDYLSFIVPPEKYEAVQEILRKWGRKSNILAYAGCCANFFVITNWDILPLLRSEFFRCTMGIGVFGKPVGPNKILTYWYPVDVMETPWTQLIYFYELWVGFWAAFVISLFEALLVQLLTLLSGNLAVVQYLLSEMKSSGSTKKDIAQLVEYVKGHQHLIRVGEEMRDFYHFLVTMQLTTATAILIMTIFNFFLGTNNGDVVNSFKFVIFSLYSLVEVVLYGYAGEDLEGASSDVGYAAYDSDWYKMEPAFRKQLQMVLVRSNNPVRMRAAWMPVNYSALTTILQMAYSTAMFMNQAING